MKPSQSRYRGVRASLDSSDNAEPGDHVGQVLPSVDEIGAPGCSIIPATRAATDRSSGDGLRLSFPSDLHRLPWPVSSALLILIETLRTMTLSTLAELSKREKPPTPEELARLSLVLRRIEGTDKLRLQREQAAAKAAAKAAPGAGQAAGQAPVRKGLSPEAVAAIREVVEGRPRPPERAVTSAPVDPWNPAESHLIPPNPGPKNGALPEMDGGSGTRR